MKAPEILPITDIRLPDADFRTFASGLQLCCVHGGDADVVRLRIVWKGGERDCRLPHVAQIAELLMPEQSKKYRGGEVARLIDFNGARFNIATTKHETILSLTVLSSRLSEVLPIVADLIHNPLYDSHTFGVMRDIVAMRYATAMVDVEARAGLLLDHVMQGASHPHSVLTTPEQVREISFDEVTDFCHRTLRCASEAKAFLSGNYSAENLRQVEDLLRNLPDDSSPLSRIIGFVPDPAGIYTAAIPEALQAGICMGLPVPQPSDPDGVNLRNTICALGGYFGSRLMRNIREDKGYTYGINAHMYTDREGASMQISVQTDISTIDPVIEETRKEMRLLAENPPEGEELERLRQYLALELAAVIDTPFSVADSYMRELVGIVPTGFFKRRVESLATLSPEIIASTASRYLNPADLRIAIATAG